MNKSKYLPNKNTHNNQVIAQTSYKVTEVSHEVATVDLNYLEPILTWLPNSKVNKGKEAISVHELASRLNLYQNQPLADDKIANSGILKGLYSDGFSGTDCTKSAPYLFYDIDVKNSTKPEENPHLLNVSNNRKIFEALTNISVLCWKSNSGNGIAGILYVPQIEQYTNDTRDRHLKIGKHITAYISDYLHKETGVASVRFDPAQSKFRQVRLVANQQNIKRTLNPKPFVFYYKSEVVVKKTPTGVTKYRYSDYRQPANSIFSQFNNDNRIVDLLLNAGFTVKSDSGKETRVKHYSSESSSSGIIDKAANIYVNFSNSFESSGKVTFRPSDLVCKLEFDNDWKKFRQHLYTNGYQDLKITKQEIKRTSKSLSDELDKIADETKASEIIFKHCFELKLASNAVKSQFIADNCIRPELKKYFLTHLNFVDYTIQYDSKLAIEEYVSEVLTEVLEYTDKHNRVILRADTGRGKTTAFIRNFHKHRPQERILILAPLTVIVDQYGKEYSESAVFLTGQSNGFDHEKAGTAKIVFSTYEQGVKHLEHHTFDYIIIDEVHQLLTANSYKADVIADLTVLINDTKTIGLTGTPSQIFTQLDFKLLSVDVAQPKLMVGEARISNKSVTNIVMTHLMRSPKGKVLIRVNSIDTCNAIIEELVKKNIYNENETYFLHSTKEKKESNLYKNLVYNRGFFEQYKIVFTTSMIDEGISIDQFGFTDVIFIETSYEPRPEPIKQFFARFRNHEPNRKNFLYLRQKNRDMATQFKPETMFADNLQKLIYESDQEDDAKDVLTTYNNLFSNNRYYYNDATANKFYLAYAVTQVMFRQFNIEQLLDYLKNNYYLSFIVNESYEVDKLKTNEKEYKEKIRQQVAKYWKDAHPQIKMVLLYHSQNVRIKKAIHKQQVSVDKDVETFAKEHLKHFEEIFLKDKELRCLGVDNPLADLLKREQEVLTLQSNDYYRKRVTVLRVNKAIFNPETNADKKTAQQFIEFGQRCLKLGTFTHKQMYEELKKCGVINYKAFKNEGMLFEILKDFDLIVERNKKTNNITCTKKVVQKCVSL